MHTHEPVYDHRHSKIHCLLDHRAGCRQSAPDDVFSEVFKTHRRVPCVRRDFGTSLCDQERSVCVFRDPL